MIKDINQVKALTLLVSSKIGSVSSDELISTMLATEISDIANITDAFVFLCQDGLLVMSADGKNCCISDTGKAILPDLLPLLGAGVAEEVQSKALRFHKGAEYGADVREEDGRFVLTCSCFENGRTDCEIKLYFDSENDALRAKVNFLKRPEAVMGAVKASVTGNIGYMI
ncbi:MAG: DUF4364 family protein [Clostridia bacterium]|nr:DUF4364 family protein [Clostridia bacterium]